MAVDVTARGLALKAISLSGGGTTYPEVLDYASLPVASSHTGQDYIVQTTTGTWLVNRHPAGLYRSNGTTWNWLGDTDTDASTISNTPAGNISSTTVQAAINELDTEKQVAGTYATGTGTASGTNTGDQTITLSGDVSGSGTGGITTAIGAGKVTLAMQANMATASVVYRKTGGAGAPEVNTLATLKTDLGLIGTNSGDQTITLTSDVTGSGVGSFATTIAAGAVSLAKMANLAASSFIGNNTGSPATPIALTITQAKALLAIANTDVSGLGTASTLDFDTDGTLAANSNTRIATQAAVKTYVTANAGGVSLGKVLAARMGAYL